MGIGELAHPYRSRDWRPELHPRELAGEHGGWFAHLPGTPVDSWVQGYLARGGKTRVKGYEHTYGEYDNTLDSIHEKLDAQFPLIPGKPKEALQHYTGSQSFAYNQSLREGQPLRAVTELLRMFRPLPQDMGLSRNLTGPAAREAEQMRPGDVYADPGFSSCRITDTPNLANVRMHIAVPAGTSTLWVGTRSNSPSEEELLLAPDTPMALLDRQSVGESGTDLWFLVLPKNVGLESPVSPSPNAAFRKVGTLPTEAAKTLLQADRRVTGEPHLAKPASGATKVVRHGWDGFPWDQRTQAGPKPGDMAPGRTASGDFVFYHGTSRPIAEKIVRGRRLTPDNFGAVGVGTTRAAVASYAAMKAAHGGSGRVEVVVAQDWLARQRAYHEIGGSGHDQLLIEPPNVREKPEWGGIPPEAVVAVRLV